MCFEIYIGSQGPLKTSEFIPNDTLLYLEEPSDRELKGLRDRFTCQHIYYVGADTGCSCGFAYNESDPSDIESQLALIELIKMASLEGRLELFCCWNGATNASVEFIHYINPDTLGAENLIEINENELLIFERPTNYPV